MLVPRNYHELAPKRVFCYLNATRDKWLVLNPSYSIFVLEYFHDADFAKIYGHKNPTDPSCNYLLIFPCTLEIIFLNRYCPLYYGV